MNLRNLLQKSEAQVRLGASHGYRIVGDQVHLNAELLLLPYARSEGWALQLWACESQPAVASTDSLRATGVLVAQLPLHLPTPIRPNTHRAEGWVGAHLPPQARGLHMVLALVDGAGEVHELSVYPALEYFPAPHAEGTIGYRVLSDVAGGPQVELETERVVNPRAAGSRSGSLTLELWALREPLRTRDLDGHCLARVELGTIDGGYELAPLCRVASLREPPVGGYLVALVVREWTAEFGDVVRDVRVFDRRWEQHPPLSAQPAPAVSTSAPAPSRVVPAAEAEGTLTTRVAASRPVSDVAPRPVVSAEPAPAVLPAQPNPAASTVPVAVQAAPVAVPAAPVAVQTAPVAVQTAPVAVQTAPVAVPVAPKAAPAVSESGHGVSINSAPVEQLAKVKGLTLKLAHEIVRSRPFASLDDLLRVRGIGDKSLQRLRGLIRL